MNDLLSVIITAVVSGSVISAILGIVFVRRTTRITQEISSEHERTRAIFQSTRTWKEQSVAELLGPVYMQLDRTKRAFDRWQSENLYLEAKIIKEGNVTIRDLLLSKGHLIPPDLLVDAGNLVAHYDRWLEQFERVRGERNPESSLSAEFPTNAFVFTYDFPRDSERKFRATFQEMWKDLYTED
jgi:hypothetical protein